jgi:adenosylcobinamide-GDP ribazoletransferase
MSGFLRSAVAATTFLTRVPLARGVRVEPAHIGRSVWLFPLVGGAVGGAAGVAADVVAGRVPSLAAGAIAVAVAALLTGAMHLDALADSADALGATTRQRALEIMRDSAVGAFGVTALVTVVLLDASLFGELARTRDAALAGVAAGAVGRVAPLLPAAVLPYARAEPGQGSVIESLQPGLVLAAAAVAAPLVLVERGSGISALAAGMVLAALLTLFFRRKFGGVTGDLLGATAKLAETLALVVLVVAGP